jgi:DNA-binding GntR family transcriptional regulator
MDNKTNAKTGIEELSRIGERKSLGQHVFENLKEAIVKGTLVPGDRLIESRLAETLGISRTPVREAMHKLDREGYLRKQPHGGFCIIGLSREEVIETFGIRGVLESYAARLATEKYNKKDLQPLESNIHLFQKHLDRKDFNALTEINTAFHDHLYALSRSPKLIRMISHLRDQIYRFRRLILKNETLAKMSNEDHKEMLAHIKKGDAEGVEKLVKEHIMRGQDAVLRSYRDSDSPQSISE